MFNHAPRNFLAHHHDFTEHLPEQYFSTVLTIQVGLRSTLIKAIGELKHTYNTGQYKV